MSINNKLPEQMDSLKKRLKYLLQQKKSLHDPEVVDVSKELDKLIDEYYNQSK